MVFDLNKLNRVARLDGYRIEEAKEKHQHTAWGGRYAIFRGTSLMYSTDSPYQLRGWLHVHAGQEHPGGDLITA